MATHQNWRLLSHFFLSGGAHKEEKSVFFEFLGTKSVRPTKKSAQSEANELIIEKTAFFAFIFSFSHHLKLELVIYAHICP